MRLIKMGVLFCVVSLGIGLLVTVNGFTQENSAPAVPAESAKVKEITLWHFWTEDKARDVLGTLILQFEQAHPDIKVKMQELYWDTGHNKISTAFDTHTEPDVIDLGSDLTLEFITRGVLLEITKDVAPIWNSYRARTSVTYNRKIYGLPWVLDTRVLFCNTDLMKQAGLDPNKLPQTWDDLKKCAEKVNKIGGEIYGIGVNGSDPNVLYKKILPFMWSNGGQVLNETGETCILDSKENLIAVNYYINLRNYGLVGKQKELDQAFKDGKLGFWISGSWLVPNIKQDNPKLNYKVTMIPFPRKSQGSGSSFAGGEYLVISKKTKYPKECLELIKYLTNETNSLYFTQTLEKYTPGVKISANDKYFDTHPEAKVFSQQLEQSVGAPNHSLWMYIKDVLENELGLAIDNKKTGETALKDATQRVNDILNMNR